MLASDGFDPFFLAMARIKLREKAPARADFDRAIQRPRDHPQTAQAGWFAELDAFQDEAKALLDGP
jgi:hypothetical protein